MRCHTEVQIADTNMTDHVIVLSDYVTAVSKNVMQLNGMSAC